MKKSTYIIIVVIVIILIAISIVLFNMPNKSNKNENATQDTNLQSNVINNTFSEGIVDNNINLNKLEVEENTQEEKSNVQEVQNNQSSETFEETPKTAEEKAIEIAKKDYGESSNVKITVEGIDENGRYIVVARDTQTTEALVFYTVNTSDSTFTKREMN